MEGRALNTNGGGKTLAASCEIFKEEHQADLNSDPGRNLKCSQPHWRKQLGDAEMDFP